MGAAVTQQVMGVIVGSYGDAAGNISAGALHTAFMFPISGLALSIVCIRVRGNTASWVEPLLSSSRYGGHVRFLPKNYSSSSPTSSISRVISARAASLRLKNVTSQ